MDRRNFLKLAGGTVGASIAGKTAKAMASPKGATREDIDNYYGYLYDATYCVACEECTYACAQTNVLPLVLENVKKGEKEHSLLTRFDRKHPDTLDAKYLTYDKEKYGEDLDLSKERTLTEITYYDDEIFVKEQCMHCLHPSCVSACPVSAMRKDKKTGIVYNDPSVCLGCRYCMVACPFSRIKCEWNKSFPRVVKCHMCRETNLKKEGAPACVSACPEGALEFGKRGELLAKAKKRIKDNPDDYFDKVFGEDDGGGTAILMLAANDFTQMGLPKLGKHSPAKTTETIQSMYTYMIAPVVAYGALAFFTYRNSQSHHQGEDE